MNRNTYIDMLRGIAALGVIAIHTAFWSGQSYTPIWFQSLTLLIDVPFFFFLSGWGARYAQLSFCFVFDRALTASSNFRLVCYLRTRIGLTQGGIVKTGFRFL